MPKQALYYKQLGDGVQCELCPHNCVLKDGQWGICRVRQNKNNTLLAQFYGEVSALAIDPIEKKPLYHVKPSSSILSIGTVGCNMRCVFCQNYHISQTNQYPTEYISPERLVDIALKQQSIGIAYTYSEPLIWYEYVLDCAKLAKQYGLMNVLVTNGFINEKPLRQLLPYIDAMNIDLKYFNEKSYKKFSAANLDDVLRTIKISHQQTFIEITHLLVTGINDSINEFTALVDWIAQLSEEIPFHISRYHPMYKWQERPTDIDLLTKAFEIASQKLNYVYVGNVAISQGQNTYCPHCGNLLIERQGYYTAIKGLNGNKCSQCNTTIPIIV